MERNDFSPGGSTPGQSGGSPNTGGTGFGNTGDASGTQGFAAGTTANAGQGTSGTTPGTGIPNQDQQSQGFTDRARDLAGSAQTKLADVGSTVRERAGNLKDSLADALDSGANKLRQRSGGAPGNLAGATETGSVALEGDGRTTQVTSKVAGGMESAADWLRDADLDSLRTGVERQVKDHPGRTLLIAAGLGYLIGRAFKNK